MEKFSLDGQYGKCLALIGIRMGEALKSAGVPEDLFSRKSRYWGRRIIIALWRLWRRRPPTPDPIMVVSADQIENYSPPIFAAWCSKNGRACLERLSRYKRLIAPMRYELCQRDGEQIHHNTHFQSSLSQSFTKRTLSPLMNSDTVSLPVS